MALKKVESSFADPWKPEKKGEKLIGIYMGSEEIPGANNGKPFTSYRVRPVGKDGKGDPKAKVRGVSGAFLASVMNQVPAGATIHITFEGTVKSNNGQAKQYTVEVDEDQELQDPYATEAFA